MAGWPAGKPAWVVACHVVLSGGVILSLFVVLCFPSVSRGEAFRILDQGAAASGQGNAFAAQADDPSAIFYNPAGMTQLRGLQFYAGTLLVGGHYDYTSPNGGLFRGNVDGSIAFPPPINFYLTANFEKTKLGALRNLTVGIGVNSPFGLIINYPREVPFSAIDTRATLPLLDIKPTAAYRINDYVSVGAGLDIYTFAGFAGEGAAQLNAFIPPGTDLELRVKDTAVGYNVGVMVTPWRSNGKPRLNLAFVYRSETTLNLTGKFLVNGGAIADAAVDLKLPQMFTWGAALWPVRNDHREWKLEVDVDYADWSSFKNLDVRLSNGAVLPEPRNWKGVFIVRVGTEYRWLQPSLLPEWEIAARFGSIRSQTPVPEATFEPAVPDANYNSFSVGLGMLCKGRGRFLGVVACSTSSTRGFGIKAIGLDVAYKNQLYESRTIANNIRPVVNGTWETVLHAGVLSLRLNF
ncbi:MAG: OmpP1/FadL family transporter [Nitrospiraceae bacterium]